MKTKLFRGFNVATIASMAVLPVSAQTPFEVSPVANQAASIPIEQLGTVAGKQYQGDGLSICATSDGARLRCMFQRLEGLATQEGLWLSSSVDNSAGERFRVMAVGVGRTADFGFVNLGSRQELSGLVNVTGNVARFIRPGLTEEYSVSVDGVRQDFIIEQRPNGDGELRVELEVTGAKAEPLVNGARLVLSSSGRKLVYHRLRVTDDRGQELAAQLEVTEATRMVLVVEDEGAVYPVRIDPTFSDADWIGLGQPPGANGLVFATVVDASGNLYIGGDFTAVGSVAAISLAKWDGNTWLALGSGLEGRGGGTYVYTLAVSGNDLYVGGIMGVAGGNPVNYIAKWDGNTWSALGAGVNNGVNNEVLALAVSGSDLYVGGQFTTAGTNSANRITKWNGSTWSALGAGLDGGVTSLAVSGSNLYVGGYFTTADGSGANRIAKWDGSAWSALGSGVAGGGGDGSWVSALAVSGSDLYVGGEFTSAGGGNANYVAKWNGSMWSSLGTGMDAGVEALVISGSDLYAGGYFTAAGGNNANYIAKWDGNNWSPLGSGMNFFVYALAVSGCDLYAGGEFTTAGGQVSGSVAKAMGPAVFTSAVPNPSGTQALLTFTTAPGASLHLLSSTNLITWQTNSTISATGVTNSVSVNMTQPHEFFRLRRLP